VCLAVESRYSPVLTRGIYRVTLEIIRPSATLSGAFERRSGGRPASVHVGPSLSELRGWL
jgi:hypothetical protein